MIGADATVQFVDAIRAAGLTPPEHVEADGELHRFASNGKRDDAGWYVYHGDGIPAGSFGCWRTGLSQTWRADIGRKLSHDESAALAERAEQARRKREGDEAVRHAEARDRATDRWAIATPVVTEHGYKIFARYKEHGGEALSDRSRRPVRYANQLPPQIESLIVRLKREKPHWGARKIRELLVRRLDQDLRIPAKSTIHAVLHRHGLVKAIGAASGPPAPFPSYRDPLVGRCRTQRSVVRRFQR